ncbi:MAG TPA: sarcosine oxidase subunit gamma family protein, partial [Ktedonobacterales bacterium]|nr:sarcosine oxidase subunit gamma family protein [Ktedonobacterales bacterium]
MAETAARLITGNDGWLRTLPPAARFILQGGQAARAAAGAAFKVPLSEEPCRASSSGERATLWLGPDERLLLAPAGEAQIVAAALDAALAGIAHSLVDVSQRQLALQVSGPYASAILNSGCPLDLDPAAFPTGMCTRSLFGKSDIIIWRTGADEFHLEVWRSFADYVRA